MSRDTYPEKICLDPNMAAMVADGLNKYLANLGVLFVKLHNLHWNVVGIGFYDLHAKTEEMYDYVNMEFDRVAERIKMLGFYPLGSMKQYLQYATIKEIPSVDVRGSTTARVVRDDFAQVVCELRASDAIAAETSDAIEYFEKNIWMLTAYLKR